MTKYPYNPELLLQLNALRDEFISDAKFVIKKHIGINEIKLYTGSILVSEDDIVGGTECNFISFEHNNFLLARVIIGNSPTTT